MIRKEKTPEKVTTEVANYYATNGNELVAEGDIAVGYRYDQVEGRKFRLPDGREFKNNVTLSPRSAEVLTLLKRNGTWFLVMGKQSRSPYLVEVGGKIYSKIFFEQAAGLVEENQTFAEAAIAEAEQELGAKLVYLAPLVLPILYRHVSYTDEMSRLYLAVAESLGDQSLDEAENISAETIPLDDALEAFKDYINGKADTFFGFDIPDVTMLSMTIFFWKLESGEINLEKLDMSKNIL